MSIHVEMFTISHLHNLLRQYKKSLEQVQLCGECDSCIKNKALLKEMDDKGLKTFNSTVDCWKIYSHPTKIWVVFPLKEGDDADRVF